MSDPGRDAFKIVDVVESWYRVDASNRKGGTPKTEAENLTAQ